MSEISYCPNCGAENETGNIFCGSCGVNMKEGMSLQQPAQPTPYTTSQSHHIPQQTTQKMYSTPLVPKTQATSPTALGIIGLIVNIITFAGLSWGCWLVRLDRAYIVIIYLVIAITGIIMSGITIKRNKTLGIVGLILGILGTIPILGALLIIVLYYLLFSIALI